MNIFDSLWVYGALGDILTSMVSNYHFWKRSEARDMTTFWSLLIRALLMEALLSPPLLYPLLPYPPYPPSPLLPLVSLSLCKLWPSTAVERGSPESQHRSESQMVFLLDRALVALL